MSQRCSASFWLVEYIVTQHGSVDNTVFGSVCSQQDEEIQGLQKRISLLEGELDQAQTQLDEATGKLENTDKQLNNVSVRRTHGEFSLFWIVQWEPHFLFYSTLGGVKEIGTWHRVVECLVSVSNCSVIVEL